MKIWHEILGMDKSLFAERYFVYMGKETTKAPSTGESAEKGKEKPGDKEKPATLDDVKAKVETAKGNLKAIREKHGKTAEQDPRYKAAKQKIAEIEEKIKAIEKEKGAKRQEVINQANTQIDDLLSKMPGKRPSKEKAKPAGAGSPKSTPDAAEKGKAKPESKETTKKLADRAITTINWIPGMRKFLQSPKNKGIKDFAKFDKRLGEIGKKLTTILENSEDKKPAGREQVLKLLGEASAIYKEATKSYRKKFGLPEPKPKEAASKPKGSSEKSKEKVPTSPKEKLSYLLGKVLEGGKKAFDQNKAEVAKLIKSLNIKPKREGYPEGVDLPGGFTVGKITWSKKGVPSYAVFKDGKTICYMDDDGRISKPKGSSSRPERAAEIIKYNVMLSRALAEIKNRPKTGAIMFTSPTALNNFKAALIGFAKVSGGRTWQMDYESGHVKFTKTGGASGMFKIEAGENTIYFNTANPNHIGLSGPKAGGGTEISYWSDGEFLMSPDEQTKYDRRKSILKKRAESTKKLEDQEKEAKAKKAREEAMAKAKMKEKAREIALAKEAQEKALRGKISKMLNPKFKKLVKDSKTDPKSFTVQAEKGDRKGLNLINNTSIHKLLDLKQSKSEVVMITIKGAKGKPERKAMYYPGQKTAYTVDVKGKQTNNRVKFFNGDTLTLDFKKPTAKEFANLNRDKKVLSPEKIGGQDIASRFAVSVDKFKKMGGKLSDLNLKSLDKYKTVKGYDPKKILTLEFWKPEKIKELGVEKSTEMLKAEAAVIQAGIAKKQPKTTTKVASKPSTSGTKKIVRRGSASGFEAGVDDA